MHNLMTWCLGLRFKLAFGSSRVYETWMKASIKSCLPRHCCCTARPAQGKLRNHQETKDKTHGVGDVDKAAVFNNILKFTKGFIGVIREQTGK